MVKSTYYSCRGPGFDRSTHIVGVPPTHSNVVKGLFSTHGFFTTPFFILTSQPLQPSSSLLCSCISPRPH